MLCRWTEARKEVRKKNKDARIRIALFRVSKRQEARLGSAQGHVRFCLAVLGLPPLIYGPVRLKKCGENFNKTG
jgi:hypothetical protein